MSELGELLKSAITPDSATSLDVEGLRSRLESRRRRRRMALGVMTALVLVVGVLGWQVRADRDTTTVDAVSPGPDGTEASPIPSPEEAAVRCFTPLDTNFDVEPRDTSLDSSAWPEDAPRLLALTGTGRLWVVEDGQAIEWTRGSEGPAARGVVSAAFGPDGAIWTLRIVDAPHLAIERFNGPGEAQVVAELPYAATPAFDGCPIDGYLDTIAIGDDRLFLLRHDVVDGADCEGASPCPYERTRIEARSISEPDTPGALGDDILGPVVSDYAASAGINWAGCCIDLRLKGATTDGSTAAVWYRADGIAATALIGVHRAPTLLDGSGPRLAVLGPPPETVTWLEGRRLMGTDPTLAESAIDVERRPGYQPSSDQVFTRLGSWFAYASEPMVTGPAAEEISLVNLSTGAETHSGLLLASRFRDLQLDPN